MWTWTAGRLTQLTDVPGLHTGVRAGGVTVTTSFTPDGDTVVAASFANSSFALAGLL